MCIWTYRVIYYNLPKKTKILLPTQKTRTKIFIIPKIFFFLAQWLKFLWSNIQWEQSITFPFLNFKIQNKNLMLPIENFGTRQAQQRWKENINKGCFQYNVHLSVHKPLSLQCILNRLTHGKKCWQNLFH